MPHVYIIPDTSIIILSKKSKINLNGVGLFKDQRIGVVYLI